MQVTQHITAAALAYKMMSPRREKSSAAAITVSDMKGQKVLRAPPE
jgi:hypothetical protein